MKSFCSCQLFRWCFHLNQSRYHPKLLVSRTFYVHFLTEFTWDDYLYGGLIYSQKCRGTLPYKVIFQISVVFFYIFLYFFKSYHHVRTTMSRQCHILENLKPQRQMTINSSFHSQTFFFLFLYYHANIFHVLMKYIIPLQAPLWTDIKCQGTYQALVCYNITTQIVS